MMSANESQSRQENLPLEGIPMVSPLEHAAQSDNPWAQREYHTYILVRDAHEAPLVDRQTRLARVAAAYEAWVAKNSTPGAYFDPDNPSPEQESELHDMQLQADPTTMSVDWALANLTRTKKDLAQLLRSEMYGAMSESDIHIFLTRPEHAWRLEGVEEVGSMP